MSLASPSTLFTAARSTYIYPVPKTTIMYSNVPSPTTISTVTSVLDVFPGRVAPDYYPVFAQAIVQVVAPKTCEWIQKGKLGAEPEPDISGIGILIAFMLSTWVVWGIALAMFLCGFLSEGQVNHIDHRFFRVGTNKSSNRLSKVLRRAMLVFSDQQLITGIAMLTATFAKIQTISVRHYALAVELAWLSNTVHLTALLVLKDFFRAHPRYFWYRLVGMSVLFIMLLVALAPTWLERFEMYRLDFDSGMPATCIWQMLGHVSAIGRPQLKDSMSIISTAILVITFLWRVSNLFSSYSSGSWKFKLRQGTEKVMERCMSRCLKPDDPYRQYLNHVCYASIMVLYIFHHLTWDILESYSGALWLITMSITYGTSRLVWSRSRGTQLTETLRAENQWSFGQIIAILLLILPFVAAIEDFLTETKGNEPEGTSSREASVGSATLAIQPDAEPEDTTSRPVTMSAALLQEQPEARIQPDPTLKDQPDRATALPAHVKFLRASLLYKILFWEFQAIFLTMAIILGWIANRGADPVVRFLYVTRSFYVVGFTFWVSFWYSPVFQ